MHWTDRYVGAPYVAGDGDCAALAERVAREVLGLDVALPQHAPGLRAQAEQIVRLRYQYVCRVDQPIEANPVMFLARGRFFHVGVAAIIGGETWVLHADQSSGFVVCQRLRDMTRWAYQFEGAYQWLATK